MTTHLHRMSSLFPALLLASLFAGFAAACSDSDDAPPDNRPPIVPAQRHAMTDEDTPIIVRPIAGVRDLDLDPLTVKVTSITSGATWKQLGDGEIEVSPLRDSVAPIALGYLISDGLVSVPGDHVISVRAINDAPVAQSGTRLELGEDSPARLTLLASDVDSDPLTFAIATPPAHGALTGEPPNLLYTPHANYHGPDSFTFTAGDASATSSPATVSLEVAPVADPPEAAPLTTAVEEDGDVGVTLQASDPDSSSFTYHIVTQPAHGALTGASQFYTYAPHGNYHGSDSFTYRVSDGALFSLPVTVAISVAPLPDPPVGSSFSLGFDEDTVATVALAGQDPDGDALTFAVVTPPALGALTGAPPSLSYTPPPNYFGTQMLVYSVSDGDDTVQATVTLNVNPRNDAPVAEDSAVTLIEDTSSTFSVQASDIDSASLTYSVVTPPLDGTLSPNGGASFTYTPAPNFAGSRTFVFRARDSAGASDVAVVNLMITPVNDPPVAVDETVLGDVDEVMSVDLLANDVDLDGQPAMQSIDSAPAHGTAGLEGSVLSYTPSPGFVGLDSVRYTIVDEHGVTATATAHFGVGTVPPGMPRETIAIAGADVSHGLRAPSLSDDGRIIAFASILALVPEDTNGFFDVYVYDRARRRLTRITTALGGGQPSSHSSTPRVSGNGRYVVFESAAENLVAGDTNARTDVFRHDRVTGETVRVSVSTGGVQGSGQSTAPQISDDGNVVVFTSQSFELVPNDVNGASDVFLRDVAAGTTTRMSVSVTGGDADAESLEATISGDGRLVAFTSRASNLITGDSNARSDVFLRDLAAGSTTRVSVSSTGGEGDEDSFAAMLSDDGRFIAFQSFATNLSSTPNHSILQVLVRDRQALTTILTPAFGGGGLSDDGRYLTEYRAIAPFDDTAIVYDRFTSTARVLYGPNGGMAHPAISGNGRYIVALNDYDGAVIVMPNPL